MGDGDDDDRGRGRAARVVQGNSYYGIGLFDAGANLNYDNSGNSAPGILRFGLMLLFEGGAWKVLVEQTDGPSWWTTYPDASPFLLGIPVSSRIYLRIERDSAAEAFVLSEANKVLAVLGDRSLSIEAKKKTFRALVDEVADVPKITGYVLGKYRRSISDADFREFSVTFREYANSVYENRLNDYKGETLKVTGSTIRKPGDVIVTTEVVGGKTREPIKVVWRVLKGDDARWRAVDVQVQGVWLAVTQQQDFVSTLDNAHGDIHVLIAQLKGERKAAAPSR